MAQDKKAEEQEYLQYFLSSENTRIFGSWAYQLIQFMSLMPIIRNITPVMIEVIK